MKGKLASIVSWLNRHYNQDSDNYDIFVGSKPGIIKYDDHTIISPWGCGAIVCIHDTIFFLSEDDGHWFLCDENKEYGEYGYQTNFSIAWAKGFTEAMNKVIEYVNENGHPVYFSGLEEKIICHYTL